MRRLWTGAILLAAVTSVPAAQDFDAKQWIDRAKNADVSLLDKALPKQKFADWLTKTVGDKAAITWEINDCGEATGSSADRDRDLPRCVEAAATLSNGRKVLLNMALGSRKRGLSDTPSGFYYLAIVTAGTPEPFKTLSELPARIAK